MMGQAGLLRAKLSPPQPYRRTLVRPRVLACLSRALDHRLTVVQAGAGYGKTTALASLWRQLDETPSWPGATGDAALHSPPAALTFRRFWLTLDAADREPRQFLTYLASACESAASLPALERETGDPSQLLARADRLINALAAAELGPAILVLDDFHLVADTPDVLAITERLLIYLPPTLHVIIATRHPVATGFRRSGPQGAAALAGGTPATSWHGVIRHVQSNRERAFSRWADAVAFICGFVDVREHDVQQHGVQENQDE